MKCVEAAHSTSHTGKQQQNSFAVTNQYKTAYNKPTSTYGANNNTPLSSSSDIIGEVTLKTLVDGYQLLKVNEMIKNAVAWRARMPKASKFSKYFNDSSKDGTQNTPEPKVHINEAMLKVMGQAAKDFGYTEQEFVEAVATRTWRMSPSPTHRTDYQSTTDLMATTKMYIARKSIL